MYHCFLIHSSADGHLGCFHVLAIIIRGTNFLRGKTETQSHPKAAWWAVCCCVIGYPSRLCDFIFSPSLWIRTLGGTAGNSGSLPSCSQDSGWGCHHLGSNGEGSVPEITHRVVRRIQLLMTLGLEGLSSSWAGARPSGFLATWTSPSQHGTWLHQSGMLRGLGRVRASWKSVFATSFWKWHPITLAMFKLSCWVQLTLKGRGHLRSWLPGMEDISEPC